MKQSNRPQPPSKPGNQCHHLCWTVLTNRDKRVFNCGTLLFEVLLQIHWTFAYIYYNWFKKCEILLKSPTSQIFFCIIDKKIPLPFVRYNARDSPLPSALTCRWGQKAAGGTDKCITVPQKDLGSPAQLEKSPLAHQVGLTAHHPDFSFMGVTVTGQWCLRFGEPAPHCPCPASQGWNTVLFSLSLLSAPRGLET